MIIFSLRQRKLNYETYYFNKDNDINNAIIILIKVTKAYCLWLWSVGWRWVLWAKGWIMMSLRKAQTASWERYFEFWCWTGSKKGKNTLILSESEEDPCWFREREQRPYILWLAGKKKKLTVLLSCFLLASKEEKAGVLQNMLRKAK